MPFTGCSPQKDTKVELWKLLYLGLSLI